jgi:hypothetical protein
MKPNQTKPNQTKPNQTKPNKDQRYIFSFASLSSAEYTGSVTFWELPRFPSSEFSEFLLLELLGLKKVADVENPLLLLYI